MEKKVRLRFGDVNKRWHGRTEVFVLENISYLELEKAVPQLKKHLAFIDQGLFNNVLDEVEYNANLAILFEMSYAEYIHTSGMYFKYNDVQKFYEIKDVGMARLIADTLTSIYNREINVGIDNDCFMLDLGAGALT